MNHCHRDSGTPQDPLVTVKITGGLVTPDKTAVIEVSPAAMPVANPVAEMVAILVLELAQVT